LAETKNNLRAPAPKTHYRPIQKDRWPWFTAARVLAVAVVLLVLGSGVYFTPDPLKDRAKQWFREAYQTYFPWSGAPTGVAPPIDHASRADIVDDATVAPGASSQGAPPPAVVERLVRMPSRPPDLNLPEIVGDFSPLPSAAQSANPSVPPTAAVTTPVPEQPDPADAIDWLLKKRQQQRGQ
jgi:hypothetical protein